MIARLIQKTTYFIQKIKFSLHSSLTIENGVCIDSGVEIKATDGGKVFIGQNTYIGKNATLVVKRGNLIIRENGFIGVGAILVSNKLIEIGSDALIAEYVTIRDQDHGIDATNIPFRKQAMRINEIKIKSNVWIGAKATITKGISIGSNSVIGAGAVVTSNIPSNVVATGVPARVIKDLS